MQAKRVVATLLSAVILAGCTACSGENSAPASSVAPGGKTEAGSGTSETVKADPFGKYEEPVTITIARGIDPNAKFKEGQSIEKNEYLDMIKQEFNIDVKYAWVCSSSDFDQKINIAIASNSLPDAVTVGLTPFNAILKYGLAADLTDAFQNYASDTLKSFYQSGGDALKKLTEQDGKQMCVPATAVMAGGVNNLWIRKDWLDKLHLEVPKTVDDVRKVAEAFVTQDPDGDGKKDTIGLSGPSNTGTLSAVGGNQWGLDPIFSAMKSFPGYWLKNDAGEVFYGSTAPETKKALEFLSGMYRDGLLDPETLVRKDSLEPVASGKSGMFFSPWWTGYTLYDTLAKDPSQNWQSYAAPLADDGKYYTHMCSPADAYMVVNKNYAHPEAAIKLLNLLIRDESKWAASGLNTEMTTSNTYPLFSIYDNADEIEVSYDILTKYLKNQIKLEDVDFTTHKLLKGDMEAIKDLKKEPLDDFSIDKWDFKNEKATGNLGRLLSIMVGDRPLSESDNIEKVYSLYYGQTKTMQSKWANLQKMENETFAKILMGQAPIDSFDTFVSDWKAQGGDQILKEISEAAK